MPFFHRRSRSLPISRLRQHALPERLSVGAADTNEYAQPIPTRPYNYYMTYWRGNALPGMGWFDSEPHRQFTAVDVRPQLAPLLDGGAIARQVGRKDMAILAARWLDLWHSLSG